MPTARTHAPRALEARAQILDPRALSQIISSAFPASFSLNENRQAFALLMAPIFLMAFAITTNVANQTKYQFDRATPEPFATIGAPPHHVIQNADLTPTTHTKFQTVRRSVRLERSGAPHQSVMLATVPTVTKSIQTLKLTTAIHSGLTTPGPTPIATALHSPITAVAPLSPTHHTEPLSSKPPVQQPNTVRHSAANISRHSMRPIFKATPFTRSLPVQNVIAPTRTELLPPTRSPPQSARPAQIAAATLTTAALVVALMDRDPSTQTPQPNICVAKNQQAQPAPSSTRKTSNKKEFGLSLARAARAQTKSFVIYNDKYISIRFPMGDVPSLYGVCTDVIIRAYRTLGVDLQDLIFRSRIGNGDRSINHRRTRTLRAFFKRKAEAVAITSFPEDYLPGDIVTYYRPQNRGSKMHIAIVADVLAPSGRPMIIHNRGWGPQMEDALFVDKITGHFRYLGPKQTPPRTVAASQPTSAHR